MPLEEFAASVREVEFKQTPDTVVLAFAFEKQRVAYGSVGITRVWAQQVSVGVAENKKIPACEQAADNLSRTLPCRKPAS